MMSRLDRQFAEYRAQALRAPLTRATTLVIPQMRLQNGIAIGLSVNK
jgi:hypothetical protein